MPARPDVRLGRIYDDDGGQGDGGHRVLVDRLWPRGITKGRAALDEWLKDAAPSTELRRWYGHDVKRFEEFTHRYLAELRQAAASAAVEHLLELALSETITLLTATHDVEHSGARVLQEYLTSQAPPSPDPPSPSVAADGPASTTTPGTSDVG